MNGLEYVAIVFGIVILVICVAAKYWHDKNKK
jgi:heme/copper-type cytochrome/quinol oxidase subunit 4